jgi:hypothetical protein
MGKKWPGIAGLACAAALAVTGCSSGAAPSAAAAAQSTGPAADQVLVCHHYMTQRAWIRGIAQPTAADALKFIGYVAADVAQSTGTGKLHADLAALAKAQRDDGPVYATSTRVYNDCAAIGVTGG